MLSFLWPMEQILPGAARTGHSTAAGEGEGGKGRALCFLASTQLGVSVVTPGLFFPSFQGCLNTTQPRGSQYSR